MSARCLHQADVTKPPPPIDDSFPHPTLLEQLRVADGQRVGQFLASLPSKSTPSDRNNEPSSAGVKISTYREELQQALRMLQTLKHSKLILEELEEDDPRWSDEVERTEQLRTLLASNLNALEDVTTKKQLTRKLSIRHKKRAWQKRRNERLKNEQTAQQASREERMRQIATWEADWNDRLNQERTAREELQKKTLILTDVRRRKARAKRVLARFEKSIRLRQQRQKDVDPKTEESFGKRMTALVAEWRGRLSECVKEEKRLKDELNRQTAGCAGRRRENRWRKVLFGTAARGSGLLGGHHSKDDWWQELVTVRRAWDRFCVLPNDLNAGSGGASVAPSTWILPPEDPLPEWDVYREGVKQ